MIKQSYQYVPNTEQQALFMRAHQLLLKYIQQQDEKTEQKQGQSSAAKVIQENKQESLPIHTMFGARSHAEGTDLDRLLA